jgi:hypothetical protein
VSGGKSANGRSRTDPITHLGCAGDRLVGRPKITVLNDDHGPLCHWTDKDDDTGAN